MARETSHEALYRFENQETNARLCRMDAVRWFEPTRRQNLLAASLYTGVCAENSDSDVLVMQTADQGMGHDASDPLNWAREWRILGQGAMRSQGVVIARIGF